MGELAERWMAVEHHQSPAWRDAAGMSDLVLPLDPDRLRALSDDLWAVLMRYRDEAATDARTSNPCTCSWPASHVWTSAGEREE